MHIQMKALIQRMCRGPNEKHIKMQKKRNSTAEKFQFLQFKFQIEPNPPCIRNAYKNHFFCYGT